MRQAYFILLGTLLAGSAVAQHEGHAAGASTDEAQTDNADAGQQQSTEPADSATDAHAGHTMAAEAPAATEAPAAADPHAGHVMPATGAAASESQEGHDMSTMGAASSSPDQAPPPEAFSGPDHAANTVFDPAAMAGSRAMLQGEHGNFRALFAMADQLEWRSRDGEDALVWDAQGWYGGDVDKLWVKSEGEAAADDSPDEIELQTLWSHAIHPWFDLQAGARFDFETGFERSHLVLGVQGLAPYSFDVDAGMFLSDEGDVSARLEAEYDVWLTQHLILQPRAEVELAAQDIPDRAMGSGLSSAELGFRLHYQIVREFSPYFGVEYEKLFGGTADYAQTLGVDGGGWNVILGMRTWF